MFYQKSTCANNFRFLIPCMFGSILSHDHIYRFFVHSVSRHVTCVRLLRHFRHCFGDSHIHIAFRTFSGTPTQILDFFLLVLFPESHSFQFRKPVTPCCLSAILFKMSNTFSSPEEKLGSVNDH